MENHFRCDLQSPCVQLCDIVTVASPIAVLGLFFLAHNHWGSDYYIMSAFAYILLQQCREAWTCIIKWWYDWYGFRIDVNKLQTPDLYESIFDYVSDKVMAQNRSVTANAILKYDRKQRAELLVFQNTGSSSFGTRFYLEDTTTGHICNVEVQYGQGAPVCVGKDRTMKQDSCLSLYISPRTPLSQTLIHEWMNSCLQASRKQIADRLDVFTLHQTSTDWIPEWKFSNSRALKSSSGQGLNYYITRPECDLIYREAEDFMDSFLCCYLVHGPSGSGKSEFATWLAGMLHVPLYILNLTCPGLDDSRLLNVGGYAALHHNDPVVLLVDEFQAVYKKLKSRQPETGITGITLEGLQQFMQSAGSLQNGVLLLCSLESPIDFEFPTSRRIHQTIELHPFSSEQLCTMAVHFVISKTPHVNWPPSIHEIVSKVKNMKKAITWESIDDMQAFIRQRLTMAKDKTTAHENQWDTFLHVLFDEPLLEDEEDHLRSSKLRRRSLSQR